MTYDNLPRAAGYIGRPRRRHHDRSRGGSMTAAVDRLCAAAITLSRGQAVTYSQRMDATPTDSALMLRYKDGDITAFEALYRRHNDSLYRYLLRRCLDREAAQDVFQEVWGKIIKSRESYRATAQFTTFLYHVAHNCFIDHLRRSRRHPPAPDRAPEASASRDDEPEQAAEKSIARRRLEAALRSLPDEQRDVFLLHEEAGLGLDAIARITGVSRETAKSRLRYAVNKLKTALLGTSTDRDSRA